ncbi:MAG: 6,7-dimethyl-8-ribityllumazine synthase [Pseudomonadota bacterium]|nr:6,7-dimethyl-8-ribityllumazine synthase [Pseudomonadota bacterium]MEC8664589.1 6,7-dimethyl-8-ribityllumazine synthase [Pseudomonadota bacterium]
MTKVLVVEARYYNHINDFLLEGIKAELDAAGAEFDVLTVPGALEIPSAVSFSLNKGYDAFVVAGCIIRGETSHYDIVCNESARGVYDLVLAYDLPLGNAILTVENEAQALARAKTDQKNKGGEAAKAALRMLEIKNAA